MVYGKSLINQWPMLQETAGIAKVFGCSECYGRNGARTGRMMLLTAKYWKPAMHIDIQYLVRNCWKWHEGNKRIKRRTKKIKVAEKIQGSCVFARQTPEASKFNMTTKGIYSDTGKQNLFSKMWEKIFSFPFAKIWSRNAAGKNIAHYQKRYSVKNSRSLKMKGD